MEGILEWVGNNKEWLFPGVGTMLLASIISIILKRNKNAQSQKIRSGSNSTNIQAGRDVVLKEKISRDDVEEK